MHNFKNLIVWQKSRALCKDIYKLTSKFPKHENFGLISQMQRCSISISSNIAEGSGRFSRNEFIHFLNISNGSAFELESQIYLSRDLNYISEEEEKKLINEVQIIQKMLYKLMRS